MKVVSTEALTKLIQLVKSAFVSKTDVIETQEVTLADVALSGDYDDLINKPTIPTATSDLTNDSGYITSSALSGYATETWVGNQGYITDITSSDVTIALGYTPYNSSNPNGYTSNVGTVTSVNNVSPVNGNVTLSIPSEVTESTVSGWGFTKNTGTVTSVNNVSPVNGNVTLSIPTVNNASLIIQKNGTNVATFTANASSNVTANISVPTNTNELTNGAGFITLSALTGYATESYVTTATANMQTTGNLVTSISSTSTNTQYPSAKCVYDIVGDIETALHTINSGGSGVNLSWYGNGEAIPYRFGIYINNELVLSESDGTLPATETLIGTYNTGSEVNISLTYETPFPKGVTGYKLYVNEVNVATATSSSSTINYTFTLSEDTVMRLEQV